MHEEAMRRLSFIVGVILLFLTQPVFGMELEEIKSSDQLARFIYAMAKGSVPIDRLLRGIESKEKLKIPDYQSEIPVREVFAMIVIERFGEKLGQELFEPNKTYATREICAFRDSQDRVWRFTIRILEEKQYGQLRRFLKEQLKNGSRG
jgi:hypothetical protein